MKIEDAIQFEERRLDVLKRLASFPDTLHVFVPEWVQLFDADMAKMSSFFGVELHERDCETSNGSRLHEQCINLDGMDVLQVEDAKEEDQKNVSL